MTLQTTATWTEIMAQPAIWRDWGAELARQASDIRTWISARGIDSVILSGAGTSAFIGDCIAASPSPFRLESSATTDVVACPQDHMNRPGRILWVQFGRSGNSSETLGLHDLLDRHRPDIDRLHITCNPDGALATRTTPGPGQTRVLLLPEATHDSAFAMTSSFTTMVLSALACLSGFDASTGLASLATEAERLLSDAASRPANLPGRAVFLGSGPLKAAARECALKVLELSAGRVTTQWDSPLGYRHGPKAAVDDTTSVFVLVHPDPHTARYDMDVAREIEGQFPNTPVTTIGPGCDIPIDRADDPRALSVLYVLPAQVLAARWSEALSLPVDDPFQGQALTRVVSGVTLYDWHP